MVYQAYGSLSEEDKEQPWLSVSGLCERSVQDHEVQHERILRMEKEI